MVLVIVCLLVAAATPGWAEAVLQPGDVFPALEGTTLSGRKIRLPDAAAGKPAVVIIGFTKEAGRPSLEWARRFVRDFRLEEVPVFQIPIIEHAPKLVRPLIPAGLRREVEKTLHDYAFLCYRDEALWKRRVGFAQADASYLFLLDSEGRIVERWAGHYTENHYERLRARLEAQGTTLAAGGN